MVHPVKEHRQMAALAVVQKSMPVHVVVSGQDSGSLRGGYMSRAWAGQGQGQGQYGRGVAVRGDTGGGHGAGEGDVVWRTPASPAYVSRGEMPAGLDGRRTGSEWTQHKPAGAQAGGAAGPKAPGHARVAAVQPRAVPFVSGGWRPGKSRKGTPSNGVKLGSECSLPQIETSFGRRALDRSAGGAGGRSSFLDYREGSPYLTSSPRDGLDDSVAGRMQRGGAGSRASVSQGRNSRQVHPAHPHQQLWIVSSGTMGATPTWARTGPVAREDSFAGLGREGSMTEVHKHRARTAEAVYLQDLVAQRSGVRDSSDGRGSVGGGHSRQASEGLNADWGPSPTGNTPGLGAQPIRAGIRGLKNLKDVREAERRITGASGFYFAGGGNLNSNTRQSSTASSNPLQSLQNCGKDRSGPNRNLSKRERKAIRPIKITGMPLGTPDGGTRKGAKRPAKAHHAGRKKGKRGVAPPRAALPQPAAIEDLLVRGLRSLDDHERNLRDKHAALLQEVVTWTSRLEGLLTRGQLVKVQEEDLINLMGAALVLLTTPHAGVSVPPYPMTDPRIRRAESALEDARTAANELADEMASDAAGPDSRPQLSAEASSSPTEQGLLRRGYRVLNVVGEGAYGVVMRCERLSDRTLVAVKEFKINPEDGDVEDVRRTSEREISLLKTLRHANIVKYEEDFSIGHKLYCVMEFVEFNLLEMLEASQGGLDPRDVRVYLKQLLEAIAYMHSHGIIYRDVKPENLLVNSEEQKLCVCDFGFARALRQGGDDAELTDYVATRWYRAPELLLGQPPAGTSTAGLYDHAVDMWAVGCLMGELYDGEPLFAGDSDMDQLIRIQQLQGRITTTHLRKFLQNPNNTGSRIDGVGEPETLANRYAGIMNDVELDLMEKLLKLDPAERITAQECLAHPFFAGP